VLGVIDRATDAVARTPRDGDVLLLVGAPTVPGLAGSELRRLLGAPRGGVLAPVDLALEDRLADVLVAAAADAMLDSASSIGRGGLFATLVRMGAGAEVDLPTVDVDAAHALAQALFSEAPGRVLVSVAPALADAFLARCVAAQLQTSRLGVVGGDTLALRLGARSIALELDALQQAHEGTLPMMLTDEAHA
jgi:phosphoribosylformylglycinamidine synthase